MRVPRWAALGLLAVAAAWVYGQDETESPADEVTDLRVRAELLEIERQAERQQFTQSIQMLKQMESGISVGSFGGGRPTEEQQEQYREATEQTRRQVEELKSRYLETTRELSRVSRRLGEPGGRPEEAAAETEPRPAREEAASGEFIVAGGHFIRADRIEHVRTTGVGEDIVEVHLIRRDSAIRLTEESAASLLRWLSRRAASSDE